jgi:hypothetical protein
MLREDLRKDRFNSFEAGKRSEASTEVCSQRRSLTKPGQERLA